MLKPESVVSLAGFLLEVSTPRLLVERIVFSVKQRTPLTVFFANTNFIVRCQSLQSQIHHCSPMIVNDGLGVDIVMWLLFRQKFPHNMNGTDFIPFLLEQTPFSLRFFLLGSYSHVVSQAADRIAALGHHIVGTCDGYGTLRKKGRALLAEINSNQPDIVLVALGNPLQEEWIVNNRHHLHAPVVMGVGAFFDFLAQTIQRAPLWLRRLHLEWLHRFLHDPCRLCRRYTWDIFHFIGLSLCRKKRCG